MSDLTSLEKEVIRMLMAGDITELSALHLQANELSVSERKVTGVGFFATLSVPEQFERLPQRPSFKLGDVSGTATNIKHGLGFLLYVTDGALSMLEGYTYDEPWPNQIEGLTLSFTGERDRDLDKIARIIRPSSIS